MKTRINFNGKTYQPPVIPKTLSDKLIRNLEIIQLTKENPLSKLGSIYKNINEYNQFVKTFTVCQPKCSHCCKINVKISGLEAAYITQHKGLNYDHGKSVTNNHSSSCPFLKDDTCSIYQYRPYNCRTFHAVDDPVFCKQNIAHVVYGSASEGYGSTIYKMFHQELEKLNQHRPSRDIRDFFPDKQVIE